MTTFPVKMTAEDGTVLTVRVPTSIPGPARVEVLNAAFTRVQNPVNWKGPIDVSIKVETPQELGDILEAIEFHTGTTGTAVPLPLDGFYNITAPGYWAGPCN